MSINYGQEKYAKGASKVSYNDKLDALQFSGDQQGFKRRVQTAVDAGAAAAIKNVELTVENSGIITLIPALTTGAQTLELPACDGAEGCTWTFLMTATAGQDFNVTTNGSEKIVGATAKGDGDNVAIAQAYDTLGFDANAVIGSRFSITCVSSTAGIAFFAHDILDGLAANVGSINFA